MGKCPLPAPHGQYAVGTATFTVYNDRPETMYCAPAGSMRHVPARLWYPADKASVEGLPRAQYLSEAMTKAIAGTFFLPLSYKRLEREGRNRSWCYEGAPFIQGAKFPLIVFHHGYLSFREANSFLCIELASHGYVVLSAGHPYEAVLTELDDGTGVGKARGVAHKLYSPFWRAIAAVVKFTRETGTNEELAESFDALQRRYCRYSMERIPQWEKDTLAALDYAKAHFPQLMDFGGGIGVTGHSMGGATAYALCRDEPEFTCGINLDGGLFGEHTGKTLPAPFLQLSCEANRKTVTRGFLRHTQPVYHAVLRRMQHLGFSDLKHLVPLKSQMGRLPPEVAHETVCSLHLEFFDTYLKRAKAHPHFESGDAVTVTEYPPDL